MPHKGWESANIREETKKLAEKRVKLGKAKSVSDYVDKAVKEFAEHEEFQDNMDALRAVEEVRKLVRRVHNMSDTNDQ